MFKIGVKSLLSHKLRMILTIMAIVTGVSFVAGTYIFTDSINKTFNNLFTDVYSGIDVTVRPVSDEEAFGQTLSFSESLLPKIQQIDGVKIAEGGVAGYAQMIGKDGKPIGGNGPPTLGFSWSDVKELNALYIKDGNGRPPETAGEVVIDVNTAKNNDYNIGDEIKIQSLGPVETFKIVGLTSFGQADSLAGATISAFELSEAQRLFNLKGQFSEISANADDGVSAETLKTRVESVLKDRPDLEVVTGEQQTKETQDEISQGLGFLNIGLLAFAGIAIFVGAYIIQNTFRIVVAQRAKELALLRAVGATRKQVVGVVLYEALALGVIASAIGIVVGVLVANGIRAIGNMAGFGLPEGDLTILPRTIIVATLVGVIVTLVSALFPALRASKISPVEVLRDTEADSDNQSLKKRGIWSGIFIVVGAGLLLYGLLGSFDGRAPLYMVGSGVFMMFVGTSFFAPILSGPLSRLIGYPFRKTYGASGYLAALNAKRNPKRTASTASALMIGVSLVSLVTIFAASLNQTIENVVGDSFPADVIAFPAGANTGGQGLIPSSFSDEIAKLDVVDIASRIIYNEANVNGSRQYVEAIDPDTFGEVIKLNPSDRAYEKLSGQKVVVYQKYLEDNNLKIGDKITIEFKKDSPIELEIVGSFEDLNDADFLVSRDFYATQNKINGDILLAANYVAGADQTKARAEIDKIGEKYPAVTIQDQDELVKQGKEQIQQILGLIWGLLGFAVFVAILGITNTLALSITERKRELGLLRAVGMTRSQMRSMIGIESVIISLFGALLGVIMGTFFAWALLKALEDEGLTGFTVPIGQILILFGLAILAGIFASIVPAFSAARTKILDAIKFE